jgi:hypothetical protein
MVRYFRNDRIVLFSLFCCCFLFSSSYHLCLELQTQIEELANLQNDLLRENMERQKQQEEFKKVCRLGVFLYLLVLVSVLGFWFWFWFWLRFRSLFW